MQSVHQNPSSEAKNSTDSEGNGHVIRDCTSWMVKVLKEGFIPCSYYHIKIYVLFFRIPCTKKIERDIEINFLRTKLHPSDLKTQSVPRSKHSLPRL